jgi:hypothetical protein
MGISVESQGLSRVIDEIFADLKGRFVFNFLDDLLVYSASVEEHVVHVREILGRLQKAGFTLNPEKVSFGAHEMKYLGHLIPSRRIKILPERVAAIQEYPRSKNLRALRRILGMVGFYGRFIPGYSDHASVVHALKKKGASFNWDAEHQLAFEHLKGARCEAPVLQIPDFSKESVLVTDASDVAISVVLNQRIGDQLAPISYYSRLLTSAEANYSRHEKECLAVVCGCEKCRTYLEHREFVLHCDNLSLCWLLNRAKDVGRLGRWVLRLVPFKFRVRHTRGTDNVVADALSHMFEGMPVVPSDGTYLASLQSLPLIYSSLGDHQKSDPFCVDLRARIETRQEAVDNFQIFKDRLSYFPPRAQRRRYVVPLSLRRMLLQYFHDSVYGGHLGALKTLQKIMVNFYWPKMREEVFKYVHRVEFFMLCVWGYETVVNRVNQLCMPRKRERGRVAPLERRNLCFILFVARVIVIY